MDMNLHPIYVFWKYREIPIIDQGIIDGDIQTPSRRVHLSSSLIFSTCSNIHLSDYQRVHLSADIPRPPYPQSNILCTYWAM